METMDMRWAEEADFPIYVLTYIKENWIKKSDAYGGTYTKRKFL